MLLIMFPTHKYFSFSGNLSIILCLHPNGSRSFEALLCVIVSPSGSPCTCIKTGFNCSLPPVSHHLSFCFLPRDVEWKADENNLHAGERKRERARDKKRRKDGAAKLWDGRWWCKSEARCLIPPANDPATGMQTLGEFRWGGSVGGREENSSLSFLAGTSGCHSAPRPLVPLSLPLPAEIAQWQQAMIKEGDLTFRQWLYSEKRSFIKIRKKIQRQ